MPQVDYNDIPYNETAVSSRTAVRSNSGNRIENIIDEITHTRQNRPQRHTRAERDHAGSNSVNINRDSGSFIQTHPILLGIALLILTIAIMSSIVSRQKFPIPAFIANSRPVDKAMPVESIPEPITTVPNATDVSQAENSEVNTQTNQVEEENAPYQDTQTQPLTTEYKQNEIQAGNSVSRESETTQNQASELVNPTAVERQNEIQARNNMSTESETTHNGENVTQPKGNQPQWMTVPPRVFVRTRYVGQPNQLYNQRMAVPPRVFVRARYVGQPNQFYNQRMPAPPRVFVRARYAR